jgi:RNA polymerase sigma-70 factor (ECF subfamily)
MFLSYNLIMDKSEEQNLIKECQQGNLEKFGELYDIYASSIFRFVYFRTRHKEIAQDLTSQIFLRAMEKVDSFNSSRGQFSSWLYRIAKNLLIDHWRVKKADLNVDDFWNLSSSEDIAHVAQMEERVTEVRELLKKLNSEQREIIVLRVWDELSWREIAEILGKNEAACKMNFSRTLAGLKNEDIIAAILIIAIFLKNLF